MALKEPDEVCFEVCFEDSGLRETELLSFLVPKLWPENDVLLSGDWTSTLKTSSAFLLESARRGWDLMGSTCVGTHCVLRRLPLLDEGHAMRRCS